MFGLKLSRRKPEPDIDPMLTARLGDRLNGRLSAIERTRRATGEPRAKDNQRAHPRQSALRVAAATFEPGRDVTCKIVDQSFGGLRIEFIEEGDAPEEFALTIPTLRFIGLVRKVWQSEGVVGVAIVQWSDFDAATA